MTFEENRRPSVQEKSIHVPKGTGSDLNQLGGLEIAVVRSAGRT